MTEVHGKPEEGAAASAVAGEADDAGLLPRSARVQHWSIGTETAKGRAVLITGAARGMGWATAKRFAAAGDRVAILDKAPAVTTEKLLDELDGTGHVAVQGNLLDSNAVLDMVDSATEQLGGLDVLVNDAGVFTLHPITEVSYEEWQRQWQLTLGVNLIGAANVTWCAVRHMKQHGGRIINITSRGAFRGEPDAPAYGASKAGLNSFTQSLAIALAPHRIAVTAVAPGFVTTDMAKEYLEAPGGDAIRAQSPFNRVAEPDEIAAAVFYLASAKAEWASGTVLDLNGASYLRT